MGKERCSHCNKIRNDAELRCIDDRTCQSNFDKDEAELELVQRRGTDASSAKTTTPTTTRSQMGAVRASSGGGSAACKSKQLASISAKHQASTQSLPVIYPENGEVESRPLQECGR